MKLNKKFNEIFSNLNIKESEKYKLLFFFNKLYTKKINNETFILSILKSFIIIISDDEKKIYFCISFLKKLLECDDKLIHDFEKIYNDFYNNIKIENDIIIEKIIFYTLGFFENFVNLPSKFVFNVYYKILFSLKRLIKNNINVKFNTYILLLKEVKILLLNGNKNISDVLNLCNKNIDLIDKYIV